MSRFLFTIWPFAGHVNPNMAVAQALKTRGHQVAVYCGVSVKETFEREGFCFFPFGKVNEEFLREMLLSASAASSPVLHPLRRVNMLRSWLVDTLPDQVQDQAEAIEAWRPDVIVSDVTMWGVPLILKSQVGLPVVITTFVPGCMINGPDAPPYGLGLPPPRGLGTRFLASVVGGVTGLLARGSRTAVDRLRRRYGLPPLKQDIQTFLGTMELYLVPSTPEFDYSRNDLPSSVHYVGPLVWNKHSDDSPPAWLRELSKDRPVVHVTEGTMHSDRAFVLEAASRGLADRELSVVMTSGGKRDPQSLNLGELAANIRLVSWVSHTDLLPITDVMVTTGGGGTIVAGLEAGVPMVVVPNQWDKPDNAQRVVEAGVGLRIHPRKCTAERLRKAVEQILADPSFRERAKDASRALKARGGAGRAAELIEGLVEEKG